MSYVLSRLAQVLNFLITLVQNCFQGKHVSPQQAHASQQLLSPKAEKVLIDWIIFFSDTGHPLSKQTIRKKAEALCGKKPCKSWILYFLQQHPEVRLGKPSALGGFLPARCNFTSDTHPPSSIKKHSVLPPILYAYRLLSFLFSQTPLVPMP
jgi:hypothetical protein